MAPATLPEGYTFEAQVGSHTMSVTVPLGGVEEGQKFSAPIETGANEADNIRAMATPRVAIPVGNWRDHWCEFCALGCCHSALCNAYYCTPSTYHMFH